MLVADQQEFFTGYKEIRTVNLFDFLIVGRRPTMASATNNG
jgi:hypothetical protein